MLLDFRDAVFTAVYEIMAQDSQVLILYNDMGAIGLDKIRTSFPGRAINMGICEQNMASVAAGLALAGCRVFIYGIIAHIFARSFEQIRNDICCPNLPIVILGVGSGLSYGSDGPTHHGVQDIAVMRTLPNMAIYNPADGVSACALVKRAAERGGPGYVRIDKEQLPSIYGPETDFGPGFNVLHEGRDVALVVTGVLVHRALEVARRLADEAIGVRVIDVYCLKPVDSNGLTQALSGVRAVVTLEENTSVGGLGSLTSELLARGSIHPTFTSLSLDDEVLMGASSRIWAERRFGLNFDSIVATLRHMAGATTVV